MRKIDGLDRSFKALFGVLMLIAVLAAGLQMLSITSLADSAAKVTATSAKIRKEPNTGSDTVGSAEKDAVLSVKGQTTGSDGYTWYQVSVDAATTGYIRSDLITITDGSTPSTIVASTTTTTTTTTTSTATTSTPDETVVEVSEVDPVSASVSGGSPVRVRQNASTTSRIVSTAQSGLALTVTGQATGTDGNEWYQVNFISNGSEVTGFIRADYVSVSGELVPAGTAVEVTQEGEAESVTESEPEEETKDWETYYADDKWHLMDNTTGNSYDIEQIFTSVETNTETLKDELSKNQTMQVVIILLVILLVALASAVSFLIFKVKDMKDAAYFNEVEQETVRRRTADRPQSSQRAAQTSGQRSGQQASGQRSGQRQSGQQASGQRSGQRSSQQASGQRLSQRSSGQRQTGQQASGQRSAQQSSGQRPSGQQASGQRSVARREDRYSENVQEEFVKDNLQENVQDNFSEKLQESAQERVQQEAVQKNVSAGKTEKPGWKSKNFMDDDEFEFQFLDWNDEEKQ